MVARRPFLAIFLRPVFPASRVQYTSDLHSKFAVTKATPFVAVWQTSNLQRLRLGEEKIKRKETTGQKYNGLPYSIGRP